MLAALVALAGAARALRAAPAVSPRPASRLRASSGSAPLLECKGIEAKVIEVDKQILKGLDLTVNAGEVHAIMGPNGSGKSTLSKVLSRHPAYEVLAGSARLNGVELLDMEAEEAARAGVFLAFQYPVELPGVGNLSLIHI